MTFNTDNQQEDSQQQQSGADQRQMRAAESDRTSQGRSREDEMREYQQTFAGSM